MAAKVFFVVCASALLVQSISCQCIGNLNNIGATLAAEELAVNNALAYSNIAGAGLGYNSLGFAPSSGGSFAVTSSSPISPTGITVFSQNAIEGALAVNGELPFLGAIAVEGTLPTAGAGGINYGCGSANVGIVSEGAAPAAAAPARLGYGAGLAGPGLALGNPVAFNGLTAARPCGALY
ncbi:unnamed protein product [Chrysodeixis includens]|uniref:Uncharacterized protein n=1 Tax=Chrysodeixis includens TaxID=689277 RepID=A0A9P0BRY2_CHRIL|nr:unnamed protein product [Chrysodeixis includens]